jgi:hypothetical protein
LKSKQTVRAGQRGSEATANRRSRSRTDKDQGYEPDPEPFHPAQKTFAPGKTCEPEKLKARGGIEPLAISTRRFFLWASLEDWCRERGPSKIFEKKRR